MLFSNLRMVSAMAYRTTFIASLGVVALVLAAGEAFADPGAARGAAVAPAVAPARPAFPSFPRHHRGGGFFPGTGGVFYGANDVREPVVEAPPPSRSDELRYTCVLDIPWDYVHRCPQYTTPR
jgi:hypothetical protein